MSERNIETRTIEITEEAYNKIMSWSQALSEVVFLTAGSGGMITEAFRLINTSGAPRNYCDYSKKEMHEVRERIKFLELEVICLGHSHPHKNHLRKPSKADYAYFSKNSLQMIAFPVEKKIGVWRFKNSLKETLNTKIQVAMVAKI